LTVGGKVQNLLLVRDSKYGKIRSKFQKVYGTKSLWAKAFKL